LVLPYTRLTTIALPYAQQTTKILMIGLGGGSISTYLGRFMPDASIDTVELDPGVIGAAKKYFGVRETKRMRYIATDGRLYLNRSKQLYDIIIVDAFYGSYIPFHLLTKEYYALLKARMAPGGAIAFNSHNGTKLYASTVRTLGTVFPKLELYPSGEGETIIVVAPGALDNDTLERRAAALQERYKFRYDLPKMLTGRVADPASHGAGGEIISDDFAPVNLFGTIGPRPRPRN
jgi:spermidine synthase